MCYLSQVEEGIGPEPVHTTDEDIDHHDGCSVPDNNCVKTVTSAAPLYSAIYGKDYMIYCSSSKNTLCAKNSL